MGQQLLNFITNVQSMPHWANQHSGGRKRIDSHEEALSAELNNVGFTEDVTKSNYPGLKKQKLLSAIKLTGQNRQQAIDALVPTMESGTYIRQPAGSQSFPDFLIKDFSGQYVVVEAKSGNSGEPAWNDSLPKQDCIYIMSSGKYNKSTFWLGQDWLSPEQDTIFSELYKSIDAIVKEANQRLKDCDTLLRGFQFYSRKKHQQGGKAEYSDPFKHHNREICEQNVLTFALAQ